MHTLVLAFLILLAAPAAAGPTWHVVKPDGLGFVAEMPTPPSAKKEKVGIGGGQSATMHTWQVRHLATPSAVYDITVAEYPRGAVEGDKIEQYLDNARNGAVSNATGPLISESKIEIGGRPAREFVIDMTMGFHSRTRIVFVGDRLYSHGAITRKDNINSPDVERFFASFKLTGPQQP